MSHFLRPRIKKDWKALNDGIDLKCEPPCQTLNLLPDLYDVERLIAKKQTKEGLVYLVKWTGYDKSQCTWEPEKNLPGTILQNFDNPSVSNDRLFSAAACIERHVKQRLLSRNEKCVFELDHDIYRHCFGVDNGPVLLHKKDFDGLPLCNFWFYHLNSQGEGRKLVFPVQLKLSLRMSHVCVYEEGKLIKKQVPRETVKMICATTVCDITSLK